MAVKQNSSIRSGTHTEAVLPAAPTEVPSARMLLAQNETETEPQYISPWAHYYPPEGYGGLGDLLGAEQPQVAAKLIVERAAKNNNLCRGEEEIALNSANPEAQMDKLMTLARRNDLSYAQDSILNDAVKFGFLTEKQVAEFKNPIPDPSPEARAGFLEYFEEKNKAAYSTLE